MQVLLFRRIDGLGWQFPQGGIETDEAPEQAMLRELQEETGLVTIEVLKHLPQPICYDFSAAVRAQLLRDAPEKGQYVGQSQHWFLVRALAAEQEIDLSRQPVEFDDYRWVPAKDACACVPSFKKQAYRQALSLFGLL